MILQLSSGQKRLYDLFYNEMSNGNYIIKLPLSFPKNIINLMVKLVLGDHPELINYDNCCVYFVGIGQFNAIKLRPVFNHSCLPVSQRLFEEETQQILQAIIKPKANTVQKALAIHDYLVNHVGYDEDDYTGKKSSLISHTAYGAIVDKKAVCEGIAYAFCHLAKNVGIDVTVVNGITDGGDHAWNMIKIGSDYYHIDATWDMRKRVIPSVKAYDYFCLCDDDLKNRNWDKKIYPSCNSSRFNYFNVTKSFAHNRQQLREIVLRQYSEFKSLYIKFDFLQMGAAEIADFIWNELLDVARQNRLQVGEVMYSLNEDQNVFILYSK